MKPSVSVIIPTYNRADCIAAAVRSAAAQKLVDTEIVIVDDASTDATQDALKLLMRAFPNIRVITHEKNKGVSAARNTGIKAAQGEHIAFLDSDDKWHKDKLAKQFINLCASPYAAKDVFIFAYFENLHKIGKSEEITINSAFLQDE